MADTDEIERAIDVIISTGNTKISILHCVSIYPSPPETINLNNILFFRDHFENFPIGYSDHTLGLEASVVAVAMGAPIIEKHFTLDKSIIGMDNQMAMNPDEMSSLVSSCKVAHQTLGELHRVVDEDEVKQRLNMRRSVISRYAMKAGHRITLEDLDFKRPGTGISPAEAELVIGKTLLYDLGEDELIQLSHLE
jgi:N-acetylneuraminate synthase